MVKKNLFFLLLGKFFFDAIQETLLSSFIVNQICSVLSVLRIKTIGTTSISLLEFVQVVHCTTLGGFLVRTLGAYLPAMVAKLPDR